MYLISAVLSHYQCYPFINEPDVTEEKNKLNREAKVIVSCILGDTLISATALAVGVLGIVGTIPGLPPAAAYTLITVSGAITLSWVFMAAKTNGAVFCEAANLLMAAVVPDPEPYIFGLYARDIPRVMP